jgi:hypothetical protein
MEFQGRIAKVLPVRSGVSQRTGNEWKSLPFIFEYFEHDSDRYADSVMLETFDTKVIDNLKEGMEVRCGFGHKTREFTKQDGTTAVINDLRLYKIESVRKSQNQLAQQAICQSVGQQPTTQQQAAHAAPFPPQVDQYGNPVQPINPDDDGLPF